MTNDRFPPARRAFSVMGGPVSCGGPDDAEAHALAELWRVHEGDARSLTHGFHPYAARMHPSLVRGAIARYARPGDRVLDPFCGSGTVLIEAFAAGCAARGLDASPLAIELSRTRTTTLGPDGRTRFVELAASIAEEAAERARARTKPELPLWSKAERTRFAPQVLMELLTLRELVQAAAPENPAIARALRMSLSSLLGKFMITREEKRIARGMPSRLLADRARELADGLEALEHEARAGTTAPAIELGDARRASSIGSASVDLVLTSPPYAGTYDYAEPHEARFVWLGLPTRRLRENQIGGRADGAPGTDPNAWAQDRGAWLGEVARVLRPSGRALLIVGDGVVGDQPEDARMEIERAGRDVGLTVRAWASELRPAPDRRLADLFGRRARHEHAILLGRG